jgi:hypothetical protein
MDVEGPRLDALLLAAARHRLGLATGEELQRLGMSLLEQGDDNATDLAIVDDDSLATIVPELEKLCARTGVAGS